MLKGSPVNELKEAFSLFPWYVYVVMMGVSLLIVVGIRKHKEKKRVINEKKAKIERKEAKKDAKRQARLRKKKSAAQENRK